MILKYTNSQGKEFDLISTPLCRIKEANFHKYSWKYEGVKQQYGINVSRFKKDPYEYEATLVFKGTDRERKNILNSFHEAMALDIINNKPGTLQWEDYYLSCFIISTNTYPDESKNRTLNEIVIFAPYPFWIKTMNREFFPQSGAEDKTGLDFPFDFEFDFTANETGNIKWNVDHYTSSHFKMIIFGPVDNPKIYVNDYPYQIHTTLQEGEYLVIDSRNHSVMKYLSNGKVEDIYNSRNFKYSVFEKMPGGQLHVVWSGDFGFELYLFLERSEPKW